MSEPTDFGALLGRLMECRRLDATALGQASGVARGELARVLTGVEPSPSELRRLAPALGLHTADLVVIAGVDLPDDLAPVDTRAGSQVVRLVRIAVGLRPEQRQALRDFMASMPREWRVPAAPASAPPFERYPNTPGALLMRLMRNRNLGWTATAQTFLVVTGRYWSASTYGGVGRGTVPLTAELLADFCAVLDVTAEDLAALTGITPTAPRSTGDHPDEAGSGVAGLVWDVRRLTAAQLERAVEYAESLRH
ncbi:helix-turn-helix transcriptional regulator [Streptomyces sp. NBC_00102]|uniref:helix-turn-helix domain-containing protein n=1 Tax=Streptomyces sp. NBC_00102 TaxID=2975652 RepID=UPI00225792F1|nr:helix-turn-helix transcriptional regulator [Streptomyces sp. NBC_00102]MCX5399124.1 helix-turn-helix domain-containing protein [Streptomyces sp. NBC_00102]